MEANQPSTLFERLRTILDELETHVEGSLASVDPQPIILTRPPSDRERTAQSLREASVHIEELTAPYRAVQERVGRALAALERRQHDCRVALAPISGVPTEILRQIFELAVLSKFSVKRWDSPSSPVTLAHVCSRWRAVVHSQRDLWTQPAIMYPNPAAMIDQYADLSSNNPLHVTIHDSLPPFPLEDPYSSETWPRRIESLLWSSSRLPGNALLAKSFDRLTSLIIRRPAECGLCGRIDDAPEERVELLKLQRLELRGLDLSSIPVISAPNLTSLDMRGVRATQDQLRVLFDSSPNLQILDVDSPYIPGLHAANGPQFALNFPSLFGLSCTDLNPMELEFFTSQHYPSLRRWQYVHSNYRDAQVIRAFALLASLFLRQNPQLEMIQLRATILEISEVFHTLQPPLSLNVPHHSLHPAINVGALSNGFVRAPLKRLELSLTPVNTVEADARNRHKEWQDLVVRALIGVLHARREAELPALEELKLFFCNVRGDDLTSLQSMVGKLSFDRCGFGECDDAAGRVPPYY